MIISLKDSFKALISKALIVGVGFVLIASSFVLTEIKFAEAQEVNQVAIVEQQKILQLLQTIQLLMARLEELKALQTISQQVGSNSGVTLLPNIKGEPSADTKLLVYYDYQCPACVQFEDYLNDLLSIYEGELSVEYRHFPLKNIHPHAVSAAMAAEAAGQQDSFWEMHEKLYENSFDWVWSSDISTTTFISLAQDIGIDAEQFEHHYSSQKIAAHVENQYREARELGLNGAPSFYLNGERMTFSTFSEFYSAIESAINK